MKPKPWLAVLPSVTLLWFETKDSSCLFYGAMVILSLRSCIAT